MKKTLIIPVVNKAFDNKALIHEQDKLIVEWMNSKFNFILQSWHFSNPINNNPTKLDNVKIANSITQILSQKTFNFQSKNKINSILISVRKNLEEQIKNESPIQFFLLYNGGYRASALKDKSILNFEPDQTEMMLLYQIALLNQKIKQVYKQGILFTIVINNGVAKWVNDISIAQTQNYVRKFNDMIAFFGAQKCVKLLVQSELPNFEPNCTFEVLEKKDNLTLDDLAMVERFLGRKCSVEEAMFRAALYDKAELKWAKILLPVVKQHNGILMRQVAHPEMLSFRPFPGGAIRSQNGTFGFEINEKIVHPKLITDKTLINSSLRYVECNLNSKI